MSRVTKTQRTDERLYNSARRLQKHLLRRMRAGTNAVELTITGLRLLRNFSRLCSCQPMTLVRLTVTLPQIHLVTTESAETPVFALEQNRKRRILVTPLPLQLVSLHPMRREVPETSKPTRPKPSHPLQR